MEECREGGRSWECKIVKLYLQRQSTEAFGGNEIFLTCRDKKRERRRRKLIRLFLLFMSLAGKLVWVHSHLAQKVTGCPYLAMSALLYGLCLITQCLVSAGWAHGYNSSLSTLQACLQPAHTHRHHRPMYRIHMSKVRCYYRYERNCC